jgi:two-component sensor histidine kinase
MHNGKPAVLVAALDISDRKRAEEQIRASLREKEVLLREIHHRVKNNLAMIISLLSLQSQYTSDETVHRMFQDTQARIRSMVLAHEVLFQSENLADIQIGEYVGSLADYLLVAIGNVGVSIDLNKEFEDISFSLDTAVPLGLIVSEIVSNSLKHAFPEAQKGEIGISLRSVGDKEFELVVRDNGVGMPQTVDLQDSTSFGLKLVQTFVRQLHGDIEIRRDNGTEVRVRFKEIRKRDWREKMGNNDADMPSKS